VGRHPAGEGDDERAEDHSVHARQHTHKSRPPTRSAQPRLDAAGFEGFGGGRVFSKPPAGTPARLRHVRFTTLLAATAALGLLAPLPLLQSAQAEGTATRADVMPVKDIKPGMKGYGLTVFEGTKPEKFDVEVIDVLKNFRPRQELILVKTKHPRLEIVKVVAGMSGSPIYINGKMIGAYAYGWTFGKEPVAGVTPIRNMIDEMERPLPKSIDGWPLSALLARGRQEAEARSRARLPRTASPGTSRGTTWARTPSSWPSASRRAWAARARRLRCPRR
jgi:hypothetical protein